MNLLRRTVLRLVAGSLPLIPALVLAAEPKAPVEIKLSPRVGRVQDVEGIVNAPGIPVVFVKSGLPQEPWWVQSVSVPTAPKQFKVRLIFGNEKSAPGSQFQVVAMLLPKTAKALDYRPGSQVAQLPEFPQSNRLNVTLLNGNQAPGIEVIPGESAFHQLEDNKLADKDLTAELKDDSVLQGDDDIAAITTPTVDSEVRRVTEVAGQIATGHTPVVLVRPMTKENLWWIQNRPQVTAEGAFKSKMVLGNEKTVEGTRFRVIVLAFEDKADADKLKVGNSLKQLPEGVKTSSEVTVTFRNLKAGGAEAKKLVPAPEPKTAEITKEKS